MMLNFDDFIPGSRDTFKYGQNFCYILIPKTLKLFLNLAFNSAF